MKKILVFQHIKREHPSLIAEYATERGFELTIVPLYEKYSIPNVATYDALVILGGSMGVYEDYRGKEDELNAIRSHVGMVPMLGICLGAQLIAHAMGARVFPHVVNGKRCKQIGYYDVELTETGKQSPLFAGFPQTFKALQWHGDTFDMPKGAQLLATDSECPHQAFSYMNAFGIQFHVEATPEIVEDWLHEDREWASTDFEFRAEVISKEAHERKAQMRELCFKMMDNFLSV